MKKVIALIALVLLVTGINSDIRFSMQFFSNGATAPEESHLNSIQEDRFGERWEEPGELTAVGMRQMFLLGTRSRYRYSHMLSPSYRTTEVSTWAINNNSTLASAESYLQGLYPPSTGPNLNGYQRNLAYPPTGSKHLQSFDQENFGAQALPFNAQVFSVRTYSEVEWDNSFMYDIRGNCKPLYYDMVDATRNNVTKSKLNDFSNAYGQRLTNALHLSNGNVLRDYNWVWTLMNDFQAAYADGKLLKRLTDSGINLMNFNNTATDLLNHDLYNVWNGGEEPLLPNITFTRFAESMLDYMDERVYLDKEGKTRSYDDDGHANPHHRLVLHSVTNREIASLLKYLQVHMKTKVHYVPYASNLAFELNRPEGRDVTTLTDHDYFVEIVYNDQTLKTVSYHEFRKLLDDTWDDDDRRWECELTPYRYWGFKNATLILIILLGICFCLTLIFFTCWCCYRKGAKRYESEENNKIES